MLRETQTAFTIANEVSMHRTSMRGAILLVEGDQDVRIYRKFALPIPHTRTILCTGKRILLDAMQILEGRQKAGVLGICDADFDRILGISPPNNVVYADHHDLEIMIAHSDAFQSALMELLGIDMDPARMIETRESIMSACAAIGRMRLWSKENDARLNFKAIDAGSYLADDSVFDSVEYVKELLAASSGRRADLTSVIQAAEQYMMQVSATELAVGHDFVALLDARVAVQTSGVRRGPETVAAMLRLAFDSVAFRKTELCHGINQWEELSGFEVLADDARP